MVEQEMEVTLEQMLAAREARLARQMSLLRPDTCLLSLTMNIAGPVKNTPLIRRAFQEGMTLLRETFERLGVRSLEQGTVLHDTGCEGWVLLEDDPLRIKAVTVELEETEPLGRLFDMDVLGADGLAVSRNIVGREERGCLICGKVGRGCASRRLHPLRQLQERTDGLLRVYFLQKDLDAIGELATRALLYEVCTTPKPGLVDRENNGSHSDMDVFLFLDSTAALSGYFRQCAKIGWQTKNIPRVEAFAQLRLAGKLAERAMLRATSNVNTHRGAVFSMGLICAAAGCAREEENGLCREPQRILRLAAELVQETVESDFARLDSAGTNTVGGRLYLQYGITGVRGQAAQGMPAVLEVGLPVLNMALAAGKSINDAGAITLLHLMTAVVDTNLIARGGYDAQRELTGRLQAWLQKEPLPEMNAIRELNARFVEKNLSPGGSADLLAICYFFHFLVCPVSEKNYLETTIARKELAASDE